MKRAKIISRSVEIGLCFVGLWPDINYATFYWFSYMTSSVIVQYFQYMYVFEHFKLSDLWLLMDCLSLALGYTLAFFKLFFLWWNRRIFYDILKEMDKDWKDCMVNSSYISTMMTMADLARRFSNIVFTMNGIVAFLLSIGEYLFQSMNNANQNNNSSRELPIKMEFPFEVSESPIFECFLIGQFVFDLTIAFVYALMDALLVTLILHVSGQIDIMRQDLAEISKHEYDHNTFLIIIRDLISKHQKIIAFSENIEKLFTNIALMQILSNTVIICCVGFSIIITLNTNRDILPLIKSISYYIAITLEAFIFCFAGEYLSAKTTSIGDAIYESLWYNLPPNDSRILLLMILRCQKRLTITAGKFIDLTLDGFASIMKATASYISVLYAMY